MNWRIIAILVSLLPIILLFIFSPVSVNDIFNVGLFPFLSAVLFSFGKLFCQAIRFKFFTDNFLGYKVSSTAKICSVRIASDFVTNTTPSYVGGEIIRIAWLTKNKVPAGKAAWIATMEIICDVFVGAILAMFAGIFAIYNGANLIGLLIIGVALLVFSFWLLVVIFSAKYNIQLPKFSLKIIRKFLSEEKSEKLINSTNSAIADLCNMSKENFKSKHTIKIFLIGVGITFLAFICHGFSFLVLGVLAEPTIGLFDSILATAASTQLGSLPITVGGSGIAELGLWAYISDLNHIPSLDDVLKDSHLDVVISWRIASYHIPLIFMWLILMRVTIDRVVPSSQNK